MFGDPVIPPEVSRSLNGMFFGSSHIKPQVFGCGISGVWIKTNSRDCSKGRSDGI